jgi:CRISPR system Cascade subunit CasB
MNSPARTDAERRLIEYLKDLEKRKDRGALAALRRGLGEIPGTVAEMHPHLARFLVDDDWGWWHECLYMIAALFASHWDPRGRGNIGDTLRNVAGATGSESIEGRFLALLKAHRDDLFDHLRHAVALARGKEVPIDWSRLLKDIIAWDSDARWVQRDWARSFWKAVGPDSQADADPADVPETADTTKGE